MFFVYLASIIAGVFWGITESINKNITEEKYSVFSYSFIQYFGNLILYTIPFILFGSFPNNITTYIYIGFSVLFALIGNISLVKSYKTEDISNINIISRISLIIAFIAGIVLLNESVTLLKIIGITSILIGILVISYEGKKLKLTSGLLFAFLAGASFGLLAYFDKKALEFTDPLSLVFIYFLFSTLLFLLIPKSFKDIKPIFSKYKKKIIVSRFSAIAAFYLIVASIERANISIVNTNFETMFLLSTLTIGVIFLKEKKNIAKKLTGSILCILGIIFLNFF